MQDAEEICNMWRKSRFAVILILTFLIMSACVSSQDQDDDGIAGTVYFYRMSGVGTLETEQPEDIAPNGDMIIVETDGHWGLIDAGFCFESEVSDGDGTVYAVPSARVNSAGEKTLTGLSSQAEGMNGRDAASFLHDALGIEHLDFIIATHGHSDHIGGMQDIAAYTFVDRDGLTKSLISDTTVYLSKHYRHISPKEDDLGGETTEDAWHNQAFVSSAERAMRSRGACVVDVSGGMTADQSTQQINDFQSVICKMQESGALKNVTYRQRDMNNAYDDCLSFSIGRFSVTLYNLFSVDHAMSENVNSIAAVITDGRSVLYTAGDLDAEWYTEQKIVRVIADDFDRVDLVKASHHGNPGSNTRYLMDTFQPQYIIISRWLHEGIDQHDSMAPVVYYAKETLQCTKAVYETARSDRAIAAVFTRDGIQCRHLCETDGSVRYEDPSACVTNTAYPNGWYAWIEQYKTGNDVNYQYFVDGAPVTGWQRIGGSGETSDTGEWYLFDSLGFMCVGWQETDQGRYYCLPQTQDGHPAGARVTGRQQIDGTVYFFDQNGKLID